MQWLKGGGSRRVRLNSRVCPCEHVLFWLFLFCFWKAKAEEKSSIEVKRAQLHLHTHQDFVCFIFENCLSIREVCNCFHWDSILWKGSWWIVFVSSIFYWGMWWYLVAHGLLWRGEVLICLTCAISVCWPMLKDFSTRVRGFFFRVVMADSAEDA